MASRVSCLDGIVGKRGARAELDFEPPAAELKKTLAKCMLSAGMDAHLGDPA